MQEQPRRADDDGHAPPDEVVAERVEQHGEEQRHRAEEEPKREDTADRTIGTEASPQVEQEQRSARSVADPD